MKRSDNPSINTVVLPGSNWFSGTRSAEERAVEEEHALQKEVERARKDEAAKQKEREAKRAELSPEPNVPSKYQQRIARKKAVELEAEAKRQEQATKRKQDAERRDKHPKHIAREEERLRREQEKMSKIEVVKKPKPKLIKKH